MKPSRHQLFLLFFLNCIISTAEAKEGEIRKLEIEKCARLESGFVLGSRMVKSEDTFFPGGSLQYSYCLKSNRYLGFGLGAGVHLFKEAGFIPFYLDLIGMINKSRNSPFVNFQTGYAFGWSKEFDSFQEPEFTGGYLIGLGFGKKIHIRDRFASYLSLSYRYQLATLRYNSEDMEDHSIILNYNMLVLSIGLMLEQN